MFAQRIREWNVDSDETIAVVILARNKQGERDFIAAHPEDDFFLPSPAGHVIALSSKQIQRP